jgi:hypothetical protein
MKLLTIEEVLLEDKARVTWHAGGDRNTKYIHMMTKIKNTTKLINPIRHDDNLIIDQQEIANHVVNHFSALFNNQSVLQDNYFVDEVIPHSLNDQINYILTSLQSSNKFIIFRQK